MENLLLLYFYTPSCGQTHGPEPTGGHSYGCPPASSTPSSSLVQCSRNILVWTMSRRGGFWKPRTRTSAKV
eukprot:1401597-Pyramimonas_sp.AAC.1